MTDSKIAINQRLKSFRRYMRPRALVSAVQAKYVWRKENKSELFVSRMAIRTSLLTLIIGLVALLAMPTASGAYTDTWNQTNWDGGVGSSTSSQYDSALGIDESVNGSFGLDGIERISNGSFNSDLDNWTTDLSEITPTVVQRSIKVAATSTTHSLTYSAVPQVGNILVATIGVNSNPGTVGVPSGWVLATDSRINNAANLGRIAIYYKVVEAGDPTSFTFTNSTSAAVNFQIQEIAGVDLTNPVDVVSTVNSGLVATTTSVIPDTAETTRASAIAVAGTIFESTSALTSWSNGFSNTVAGTTYGYSATKQLSSKQQVNTTFTAVTSRRNAGAIVVFRGALTSQQNDVLPGVIQARTSATTYSRSITPDTTPQVGNLLVVSVTFATNPGTVTLPDGWVESVSSINVSSLGRAVIYHKVVEANDPPSFVLKTSNSIVTTYSIHELSGIDTSNPLDVTSTVQTGATTGTTIIIPDTPTTSTDDAIAIARGSFDNTSAFSSWSNSFTNLNGTTSYGYTATKILTTTQQVSTTLTGVTNRRRAGALAVFKAAPSETPAIVQSKNNLYAQSTVLAATYLESISQGNTLFATFATQANVGTVTPPAGWTEVAFAESASGRATALYSKVASNNEPQDHFFNFQYPFNGTFEVYEVRGIYADDPIDQTTTFANVNTNPLTFSLPITTQNQSFILGGIGNSTTSGFPVSWAASGFSTILGSSAAEFQTGYKIQSVAAANNISMTNASLRILQGYLVAFNAGGNYVSATRDTGTKYAGASSAKIESSPWANTRFTQLMDVADTETYEISTYIYNDGDAVDETIAELFLDEDVIATDYASVGSGWYKLSAEIVGQIGDLNYGVEVKKGSTVYVDEFSVDRLENTGTLTSNIFDTGRLSNWGQVNYITSGSGVVSVKVRSSNSADMTGAPNFSTCSDIVSGADISSGTNGCVTDAERYIQYQVILDIDSGNSPIFEDISIDYVGADQTPPDTNASNIEMFRSNGGDPVSLNGWTNGNTPYFSWDQGLDNAGGIGVAGYCAYLGADETADPLTAKGLLDTGDLDVRGTCPFATENDYLDLAAVGALATQLTTSNTPYYLNLKAIDGNGNVFVGSAESFHFRFDNTAPTNPAFINAPSSFISSKQTTLTWVTSGGSAPTDNTSGIAGLQYRIGISGTWYGDSHDGSEDFDDLLANDGEYETIAIPDFDDLVEGNNIIYFRTWDNAGNISIATVTTVLKINTAGAPSAPQNLVASPPVNTANSFAFDWIAPAEFVGNVNALNYCYTVNTLPNSSNCTYTGAGITELAEGPFATQPGINTLYVVARDESNSINYSTFASVEFVANTAAPGIPLSLDLADTSVRSSSNWRIVVSWEPPTDVGAGISSYQIYRSTDGIDWVKAGTTSGTSYVDTGLSQVEYFYKTRACDSANNCGSFSAEVDETPTGRFTTPPLLTNAGGTIRVSDIQTRSATFNWNTDRNADSKIAFGIASGSYGATEAYSSLQTTDHEIKLDNLAPGTTYYFVARWTDTDGNTGTTTEQVFTTLPPPTVEDVNAIEVRLNNATLQYTTSGAANVKVYYGITNGFGAVIETATSLSRSTYLTALENLLDGTKYYYKINTFDASGFEYDGTTLTFDTPPAPKISNLRFQPVAGEKSSTQLVSWETNVPSTSELSYGVAGGETLTALDTTLTTTHAVTISNLVDDSTYNLIARSRDAAANLATSDTQTFKTELDTRPPKVTEVAVSASIRGVGSEARGQIIVSWKTDEPATSQVAYGEGTTGDLGSSTAQDGRLTLDHAVVISDLSTSKVYSIRPISFDKGQNKAEGDTQSAIVGRGSESALGIIFSVLQKIFGVGV